MRRSVIYVLTGLLAGVGCGLLSPYPGDGNPAELLAESKGADGGSPIVCPPGVTCEERDPNPLLDPATDSSIQARSERDIIVAIPGEAFTVDLRYAAIQNQNVVGGGIKFPGSNEIQWTFIEGLEGTDEGNIRFGYVVDATICDEVPPLCHEIKTEQFAVGRNPDPDGDLDNDGRDDGEFVVSEPAEVSVILRCAACGSPSCREIEGFDGECLSCSQPRACQEVFDLCFADGKPKAGTEEAANFDMFFGPDGLAWKSNTVCQVPSDNGPTPAEDLCESVLSDLAVECMQLDTDTDTDTDGMTMSTTG